MPRSTTVFALALCSPTGLEEDREIVRGAVAESNRFLVQDGRQVEVRSWDTDVRPSIGSDAQDVVNREIIDSADIGLVLIGDSLGSPTPRAPSGTVEEVRSFVARRKAGEAVDLMLFFKRLPVRYDRESLARMQAIVEFREEMQNEGVFWKEYEDVSELAESVRLHLPATVRALQVSGENLNSTIIVQSQNVEASSGFDDLEDGVLDNEIAFAGAMKIISDAIDSLGRAADESTYLLESVVGEIGVAANEQRDPLKLRELANSVGNILNGYASVIHDGASNFENSVDSVVNSTISMIGFTGGELDGNADDLVELANSIREARLGMASMASAVAGASETFGEFPSLTKELNAARRRVALESARLERAVTRLSDRLLEAENAARERASTLSLRRLPGLGG